MPLRHAEPHIEDDDRVEVIHGLLRERGFRIATAESLTGGKLASAIVSVPGASEVFDGGVVTYADETKVKLLGVDPERLASHGAIDADVAVQMAKGAAELFGTQVAVATTGIAGPDFSAGIEPGTAYVAVLVAGQDIAVRALRLKGDRSRVRGRVVARALELTEASLRQNPANPG